MAHLAGFGIVCLVHFREGEQKIPLLSFVARGGAGSHPGPCPGRGYSLANVARLFLCFGTIPGYGEEHKVRGKIKRASGQHRQEMAAPDRRNHCLFIAGRDRTAAPAHSCVQFARSLGTVSGRDPV